MKDDYPAWAGAMRIGAWVLTNDDLTLSPGEADRRARRFRNMRITAVVSFGFHFRWDWIRFWPQIRECTRLSVEACHRNGIRYIEHHSACFVTRLAKRSQTEFEWLDRHLSCHTVPRPLGLKAVVQYGSHRLNDWYLLNRKTGAPAYWPSYRALCLCPNNPDYQRAYLEYLRDFLAYTRADGIMSDDVTMGRDFYACVCPSCLQRFRRETGFRVPAGTAHPFWRDLTRPDLKAWVDFRARSVRRHFERIAAMLERWPTPMLHTTCATEIVMSKAVDVFEKTQHFNATFMEMMYSNHYFHNWRNNSAELRTYRALARPGRNPSFAISYPRPDNGESFFVSAFCRMEEHAVWLSPDVGRHSPQSERLDPRWFRWEAKHEDLFRTAGSLAATAVLCSPATLRYYRGVRHELYGYELKGWCGALQEAGVDYDMVLDADLRVAFLKRYRVLVVPNGACLTAEACREIASYVRAGGRLVASHETSLFDAHGAARRDFGLAECLGVHYRQTLFDEHYRLQAGTGDARFLAGVFGVIPHRAPYAAVEPAGDARVSATSFVDCGGVGRETLPAIVEHEFGKGRSVYVAGKPGILVYHPGLNKVGWDGEDPGRYSDYRVREWARIVANIVRIAAGPLPIELKNTVAGVLSRGVRLADDRLAIYLLNAAGSEIPHGTRVAADAPLPYPAIAFGGKAPCVECRLGRIVDASLISPDLDSVMRLRVTRSGSVAKIAIPQKAVKRFGVVVLNIGRKHK